MNQAFRKGKTVKESFDNEVKLLALALTTRD